MNQARAAATARMQAVGQKGKERWDKALNIVDFDVGDYVKLTHEGRHGLEPQYKGLYVVIGKNKDFGTYKLETLQGQPLASWIHVDRLAKVTRNQLLHGLTQLPLVQNGVYHLTMNKSTSLLTKGLGGVQCHGYGW